MLEKMSENRAKRLTIASLILLVILTLGDWTTTESAKGVTLVYVGADNCAPCDNWQRNQGMAFRNSAEFNRVSYREVKSPNLFDVLKDNYWPEDLRIYREAIDQRTGVPLWLVIADDHLVLQRSGLSQWQDAIFPKIQSLTSLKIRAKILAALPIEWKIGNNR